MTERHANRNQLRLQTVKHTHTHDRSLSVTHSSTSDTGITHSMILMTRSLINHNFKYVFFHVLNLCKIVTLSLWLFWTTAIPFRWRLTSCISNATVQCYLPSACKLQQHLNFFSVASQQGDIAYLNYCSVSQRGTRARTLHSSLGSCISSYYDTMATMKCHFRIPLSHFARPFTAGITSFLESTWHWAIRL